MNGYTLFSISNITKMKNKKTKTPLFYWKLAILLLMAIPITTWAQKDSIFYDEDSCYSVTVKVYKDYAEVTSIYWTSLSRHSPIMLPSHVGEIPVTTIAQNMSGGYMEGKGWHGNIELSVVIPSTVTEIKDGAFASIYSLKVAFTTPSSLKKIGKAAFAGCNYLNMEAIPESVEEMGEECFGRNPNLRGITLPYGLKTIPKRMFMGCLKLTNCVLPQTVETIETEAFSNCSSFNATLPHGLREIGAYAFSRSGFKEDIPQTVESIGEYAFSECKISTVNFPKNLATIKEGIFQRCENLKKISIPEKVASIGAKAFYECKKLSEADIPTAITSIGARAFSGTALTHVVLPHTLVSLGTEAFSNCTALASANITSPFLRIIPDNTFYKCNSLTSIQLPESIMSIGNSAFSGCPLKDIDLPDSLRSIGDAAFDYARFRAVIIPPLVESIGENAFKSTYNGTTPYLEYIILETKQYVDMGKAVPYGSDYPQYLIVPASLKAEYEAATQHIAVKGIWGYDPSSIKEINANQYYTFLNRTTGDFLQLSAAGENEAALVGESDMRCSAGAHIRLVESGTANKYYMAVQNVNDPMLGTLNFKGEDAPIEHPAFWRWNLMVDGQYLAVDDKGNFVKTDKADDNADWYIAPTTEFDVKMKNGEDGLSYATLYLPFDVQASGSSKMYVATGTDDKTVKLTEVADGKLKSGNGALIMNSEGADVVTLQITSRAQKPSVNLFEGSYKDQYQASAENEYYVLDFTTENGIGFYPPETPVLKANEAYLPYNDANQNAVFLSLDFENSGSGIHSTTTDAAPTSKGQMFDLQGRRIMHRPQKGIYIMDGRKYVVK